MPYRNNNAAQTLRLVDFTEDSLRLEQVGCLRCSIHLAVKGLFLALNFAVASFDGMALFEAAPVIYTGWHVCAIGQHEQMGEPS